MSVVPRRYLVVPALWAVAALFCGISLSAGGAALLAFCATIVFTVVDIGLLRGKLFGKIGKTVVAWWLVHLVAQTAVFLGIVAGAYMGLGIHAGSHGWVGTVAALATWGGLCWDTMKTTILVVSTAALVRSSKTK